MIEYDQGGGIRDATDAEVLEAAANIIENRMDGTMTLVVQTAVEELAEGVRWCELNGYHEARVAVLFDMAWGRP